MTCLRLPGGTDIAEMALFDVDALPQKQPRNQSFIAPLVEQERLVRFPTGADGGYLLGLFINEPIPADIKRYCDLDDPLTGYFRTTGGRIAFGGSESAYAQFKPNSNIRADGVIEPGRYAYTAYHTDVPDEVYEQMVPHIERTTGEWWLEVAPVPVFLMFAAAFGALIFGVLINVPSLRAWALAALAGGFIAVKARRKMPVYQTLMAKREQDRREEELHAPPSIVIELRSMDRSADTSKIGAATALQ
jgi:hypothetical protein